MSVCLRKFWRSLSGWQFGSFYHDLYQNFKCAYPSAPQFYFQHSILWKCLLKCTKIQDCDVIVCVGGIQEKLSNYPQTEELRESKRVLLQNTVPTICLETRAKSQGTHPKTLGSHGLLGRARFYEVGGTAVFGMFMVYSIFFCIIYKISYELSSKSSLTAMRKKAVHSWTMSTPRQVINPQLSFPKTQVSYTSHCPWVVYIYSKSSILLSREQV